MDIKNMPVKLNMDTVSLPSKTHEPESHTIMRLKSANTQTELSLYDVYSRLTSGYACTGGLLSGRTDPTWLQQQLWLFDFDNKSRTLPQLTIKGAKEVFQKVGINPIFAHETYSSTSELRKFRIGCVGEVVTCTDTRRRLMEGIVNLFPTAQEPDPKTGRILTVAQIDRACVDAARFFYGCTPSHYAIWFDDGEAFTI